MGWISHNDCRFGFEPTRWPPAQGTWLAAENNWPVIRRGNFVIGAGFAAPLAGLGETLETGLHALGRKCGLISAVTLVHSFAPYFRPIAMWTSFMGAPANLQLTLSPLLVSAGWVSIMKTAI